jgi:hypothetical protein
MGGKGMGGKGMGGKGMGGKGMGGKGMGGKGMSGKGMSGKGMGGKGMSGKGMGTDWRVNSLAPKFPCPLRLRRLGIAVGIDHHPRNSHHVGGAVR